MSTSAPEHETHQTQAVNDLSDSQVRQYLRKLYYVSNDISLEKEWGELFAEDGVYIMGNRKATGPEGTAAPPVPPSNPSSPFSSTSSSYHPIPCLHCYSPALASI
ncbi:hypothetical protein XPA_006262 [Xanthoria parietina]